MYTGNKENEKKNLPLFLSALSALFLYSSERNCILYIIYFAGRNSM